VKRPHQAAELDMNISYIKKKLFFPFKKFEITEQQNIKEFSNNFNF